MTRPLALVTGASSGIGLELARLHAERGGDLILVARREDRLNELRDELADAHQATSLVIASDLAVPDSARRIFDAVQHAGLEVDYLINNAGFGGIGRYHEQDWERHRSMIQVNITSLAELCHLFLPGMIERGRGRILNVASVAGYVPGPLQPVYYASKAFVVSLSEAIDAENSDNEVSTTVLCPGMTDTEFFDAAGMGKAQALRLPRMSARRVAEIGYGAMLKGRRVSIPGMNNWLLVHVALRLLPRRLTTWMSHEMMRVRE